MPRQPTVDFGWRAKGSRLQAVDSASMCLRSSDRLYSWAHRPPPSPLLLSLRHSSRNSSVAGTARKALGSLVPVHLVADPSPSPKFQLGTTCSVDANSPSPPPPPLSPPRPYCGCSGFPATRAAEECGAHAHLCRLLSSPRHRWRPRGSLSPARTGCCAGRSPRQRARHPPPPPPHHYHRCCCCSHARGPPSCGSAARVPAVRKYDPEART